MCMLSVLLTKISIVALAGIQRKIFDQGGRHVVPRVLNVKNDKDAIAAWQQDLNGNPSRLQRTFCWFLSAFANSLLSDRAGNQYAHARCGYAGTFVSSPSAAGILKVNSILRSWGPWGRGGGHWTISLDCFTNPPDPSTIPPPTLATVRVSHTRQHSIRAIVPVQGNCKKSDEGLVFPVRNGTVLMNTVGLEV